MMRSFAFLALVLALSFFDLANSACTTCIAPVDISPTQTSLSIAVNIPVSSRASYRILNVAIGDVFRVETCDVTITDSANKRTANTAVRIGSTADCANDLTTFNENVCGAGLAPTETNNGENSTYTSSVAGDLYITIGDAGCNNPMNGTVVVTAPNFVADTNNITETISVSQTLSISATITRSITNSWTRSITNSWSITQSITESHSRSISESITVSVTESISVSITKTISNTISITSTDVTPIFCGTSDAQCDNVETDGNCCNDNCRFRHSSAICAGPLRTNGCWRNRICDGEGLCRPSKRKERQTVCGGENSGKECDGAGNCVEVSSSSSSESESSDGTSGESSGDSTE